MSEVAELANLIQDRYESGPDGNVMLRRDALDLADFILASDWFRRQLNGEFREGYRKGVSVTLAEGYRAIRPA